MADLGLVIAWAGMLLRLWAVRTLGGSFTTTVVVRPEQAIIATGPYRYVRHPSYLGLLILFLGLGLTLGDLASAVAIVVLPAIALVWRIRVEEAALRAGLGSTSTWSTPGAEPASSPASGSRSQVESCPAEFTAGD